jgi:hypothetical protein
VHESNDIWVKDVTFDAGGEIHLNNTNRTRFTKITSLNAGAGLLFNMGAGETGISTGLVIENSTYNGASSFIGFSGSSFSQWYVDEIKHNNFTSTYIHFFNVPSNALYLTKIYNNLIYSNNLFPGWSGTFPTYTNTTRQPGKPIAGNGTEIGGNYYRSQGVNIGYSETCADGNQDGFCDTTTPWGDALALTMTAPPQISNIVCSSVDPVANDNPAPANMQVNFTIYDKQGFVGSTVLQNVSYNALVVNGTCGYVETDSTHRNYSCNNTMHYWYDSGMYTARINYTDAIYSVNATAPSTCGYSALIDFKYIPTRVMFPGAAPGVLNTPADAALLLVNDGNVARAVSIIAHDLHGVSSPGNKIVASAFKAGLNLTSAVSLADGIEKDLNITVSPGQNVSVWLWLSMPGTTVIQSYVTTAPWQLINS